MSGQQNRREDEVQPPLPGSTERPGARASTTPHTPARNGDRAAGRHHASQSRGDELLRQHGAKFASFSAIGGGVFVAGLLIQAVLTSGLHVPSFTSYLVQAVVSVEASYLLNRWFTWKGVKAPFWSSFLKYNLQKVVTVTLNLTLYGILLKLGMEYLLDNILLTIVFTFVNYIGADRIVFLRGTKQMVAAVTGPLPLVTGPMPVLRLDQQPAPRQRPTRRELPSISVVIPVRANEKTIKAAVESILGQDYPLLRELILVGSPGDSTWEALRGIDDPRLFVMETETPPGIRDANFKRDLGIRETAGDLVSLIDSDMVIAPDWMSNAVRLLMENGVDCVAGVMRSIRDDFWGRFVDRNRLGAKTPRAEAAYLVTAEGFGAAGYKPPITADILFTRKMYEDCPIDSTWSHGSLEDYEWFWRVVERGHRVLVSDKLFGWHHHRAGMKNLAAEYRRSARGCAYFIRAHRNSPFAQKRMTQAIMLPLAAFGLLLAIVAAALMGHAKLVLASALALGAAGVVLLSVREFVRSLTPESLFYPIPALVLGLNYTASLATHLIRNAPMHAARTANDLPVLRYDARPSRAGLRRLLHPLTFILAVQAGLSLSLVWSNTAFGDEANYLWGGRLELDHWLHGTAVPSVLAATYSGSPKIYPPLGALANDLGGLAAARMLSLVFMLAASILLWVTAQRLFNPTVATIAASLWVVSEPVIRVGALATYDAMAIFLTSLSSWLVVRALQSRRQGELVALSALFLGAGDATAYSETAIAPIVIILAFCVASRERGVKAGAVASGWFAAAWATAFVLLMTVLNNWAGAIYTVFSRSVSDSQGISYVAGQAWLYGGFIICLTLLGMAVSWSDGWSRRLLVGGLAVAVFIPVAAQLHASTAWSIDKHIAYGSWFSAMAAAYGIHHLTQRSAVSEYSRIAISAVAVVLLLWPAYNAWQTSWNLFHSWSNSASFTSSLSHVVSEDKNTEPIFVNNDSNAYYDALYYMSAVPAARLQDWGVSLSAPPVPRKDWERYDAKELASKHLSIIVLFYPTTVYAPALAPQVVFGSGSSSVINTMGQNIGVSGLEPITAALEARGSGYRIAAQGPYDSRSGDRPEDSVYVIWEKVPAA